MKLEIDGMVITGVSTVEMEDRVVRVWMSPNGRMREIRMDEGNRVGYKLRGRTANIGSDELQMAVENPEEFKEQAEEDETIRLFSVREGNE